MKILVTGASGFLGRAVVEELQETFRVAALGHQHAEGHIRSLDLRDAMAWRSELEEAAPDLVVHCAAYRDPDFCERYQEETRRLNITPLRVLADSLPPTARVIFISTDYVFDGQNAPYREESARHPINFYGQSKLEAEDIVLERAQSVVLRIPLLMGCGPTFNQSGLIAKMIQSVRSEELAELDDRILRFPTDITDIARAIRFLIESNAAGIYHATQSEGKTQYGWAMTIASLMGQAVDHIRPVDATETRIAARPLNSQLAMDRLQRVGFVPQNSFEHVARKVLALES